MTKKTIWNPTLIWLAAVTAALALALASPSESSLMGSLPTLAAKRLDQQQIVLPHALSSDRTLALIAFKRDHRDEIASWIDGLRLNQDTSIDWFKMPVLNDPGNEQARSAIENRLLERHPADLERSRVVPVFTDREAFVRSTALNRTEHAWILVLNRQGKVLARAEGKFDEDKAQALRQTLLAQGDD